MKCMETPRGLPKRGTGDRRHGFQDEMVVRLGSFCLAARPPGPAVTWSCCSMSLCDLLRDAESSLSSFCHEWSWRPYLISWAFKACGDDAVILAFPQRCQKNDLSDSKAMCFTEVRESLSALFREIIYPQKEGEMSSSRQFKEKSSYGTPGYANVPVRFAPCFPAMNTIC